MLVMDAFLSQTHQGNLKGALTFIAVEGGDKPQERSEDLMYSEVPKSLRAREAKPPGTSIR